MFTDLPCQLDNTAIGKFCVETALAIRSQTFFSSCDNLDQRKLLALTAHAQCVSQKARRQKLFSF